MKSFRQERSVIEGIFREQRWRRTGKLLVTCLSKSITTYWSNAYHDIIFAAREGSRHEKMTKDDAMERKRTCAASNSLWFLHHEMKFIRRMGCPTVRLLSVVNQLYISESTFLQLIIQLTRRECHSIYLGYTEKYRTACSTVVPYKLICH